MAVVEYRRRGEWELHRIWYCVRGVANIDVSKELEPIVLGRLRGFMGYNSNQKKSVSILKRSDQGTTHSVAGPVCPPFLGNFTCLHCWMIRSDTILNQPMWCPEAVKKMDAKILGVGEQFEDSERDIDHPQLSASKES